MPDWLSDASANRHIKTYVKDFLDVSGNMTVRQNNTEYGWSAYGQMMMGKYSTANGIAGYFGNGAAMDASGTTIAIGANAEGNSISTTGGNAYVMKYDVSAGIWYQIGQTLTGGANYAHYLALSHDGTRLAVGDYGYSSNLGAAFAYDYNSSTNTWVQLGGSTDMVNTSSGRAVDTIAISGDGTTILVGGIRGSLDGCRIYRYNGSSAWNLIGDLNANTLSDVASTSEFAFEGSISYNGNRIVLGEYDWDYNESNTAATNAGRAFVFDYDGEGTSWSRVGDILYPQSHDGKRDLTDDRFGWSVDMNPDGTVISIAAYRGKSSSYASHNPGYVAVYQYDTTVSGLWKQLGSNIYGKMNAEQFGAFAHCLSHDGYTLIAGSRYNYHAGYDTGYFQKFVYDQSKNQWLEKGKSVHGLYHSGVMQRTRCNYDASIVYITNVTANVNDYDQGVVHIYKWGAIENTGSYFDISGGVLSFVEGRAKTNALKYSSTQLGQIFKGERANDNLGQAVTMSGNGMVMASGAPNSSSGNAGYVKVFKYNKNSDNDGLWNQHAKIFGNTTATRDYFGSAVKLSRNGNVLAVGAVYFEGYTSSRTNNIDGFVRVFKEIDNVWTQIGSDIEDITQGDGTGGKATISLNSDGTILAVGSFKADSGNGAVRVFEYDSEGNSWSQLGSTLYGDNASSHDFFGTSVDLNDDGTMLAVGAPINIGGVDYVSGDTKAGYAKVYKYANGSWSTYGTNSEDETQLKAGTRSSLAGVVVGNHSDCFGICVSFNDDGTTLAVGARFLEILPTNVVTGQGCMTVFKYSSEGNKWMNYGQPIFPDGEIENQAADSVSLSSDGKTMLIGNRLTRDGHGTDTRGSSQVYKFIEGNWRLIAGPFYGIQGNQPQVTSVSMSSDGTRFVHGMYANSDVATYSGAMQSFQIDYERATLKIKDGVIHAPTGVGAPDGELNVYLPYLTGLRRNYEQIWGNNIGSGTYNYASGINDAYLYVKSALKEEDDLLLTGTSDGYDFSSKGGAASGMRLSCVYGSRTSLALGIGGGVSDVYHLGVYGNVYVSGSRTSSDDRLKHNEEPITNALETIRKLTPKHYIKTHTLYDANHDFVLDASGNPLDASGNPLVEQYFREDGLIAQEVELIPELKHAVNDECISKTDGINEPKTVNYSSIFVRAVKALQELDAIDQQQQATMESLEARIEALENK